MRQLLKGGRVWRSDHSFAPDCAVLVEDGKILSVGMEAAADEVIDARGLTVRYGLTVPLFSPACAVGIDGTVGSIEPGRRADLLLVDDDLCIREVFSAGNRISLGG